MLREADLFTMAEEMLVEVLGRIGDADRDIELPPMSDEPGSEAPASMWTVVERYAADDASVPATLSGAADSGTADLGVEPQLEIKRIAAAAIAAAGAVTDGAATVHPRYGSSTAREYLLRLTVNRSLVAHYVAAYLGSTACPLPEELARPLWELTAADAQHWRELGIFREPTPIPDKASWRDTFLRTAGHEPHPLGH